MNGVDNYKFSKEDDQVTDWPFSGCIGVCVCDATVLLLLPGHK